MTATSAPPACRTAPSEPAIRVRGLEKRYGRFLAVEGLDLDVNDGVFGLIGPNGAGKTTTMLALTTLLAPDAGTVRIFGHDPAREPREVRRLVGWMPDFFGVYEGLSCAEYLDFFAAAYRVPVNLRRRRVADLLELVDLGQKRDTDVAALSRGMQQRLGLARTLVHEPQLLVLDEPASGLDPRARVDLREILLELARQGKTILVSSHILSELAELCDRIGILESGRMLAQGTPEEIRATSRTLTTVTARLLGGAEALQAAVPVATASGAIHVRIEQGRLRAEVAGGEEGAADLLAVLVAAGVRVTSFSEEGGGLEQVFLAVTEGIVR